MVDLLVIVVVAAAALSGWRRGLLTAGLTAAGFLAGGYAGVRLVPRIWAQIDAVPDAGLGRSLALAVAVLLFAAVGAVIGEALGRSAARRVGGGTGRAVDGLLGAVAVGAIAAVATWLVVAALRPALPERASGAVADSRVLAAIDRHLPDGARSAGARFRGALEGTGVPEVFDALTREPVVPTREPDANAGRSPALRAVSQSIVRVRAVGDQCGYGRVGSGWVVAPQRVVTNAHVVAGADSVTLQVTGMGSPLQARLVAFDAGLDLAVLAVPELTAPPLPRVEALERGADVVAIGFPRGGDYTISPGRVRAEFDATGLDIYAKQRVTREVYSLRTDVAPGNSGGPLLTLDGEVAGTIFATSRDAAHTAYALTDEAGDALLDGAASYTESVSSGACLAA